MYIKTGDERVISTCHIKQGYISGSASDETYQSYRILHKMNDQPNSANLFQFTAYEKEDIALFEWVTKYTGYKVDSYSRYDDIFLFVSGLILNYN